MDGSGHWTMASLELFGHCWSEDGISRLPDFLMATFRPLLFLPHLVPALSCFTTHPTPRSIVSIFPHFSTPTPSLFSDTSAPPISTCASIKGHWGIYHMSCLIPISQFLDFVPLIMAHLYWVLGRGLASFHSQKNPMFRCCVPHSLGKTSERCTFS